jgi:hypothetical protein
MEEKVVPLHAMKAHRGREVYFLSFLTSEVNAREWLNALPAASPPEKDPSVYTQQKAGWALKPFGALRRTENLFP